MPTGGVEATEASIKAWFAGGVACVGMGSNLITKELVAAGDFEGISRKVAQVLAWISQARGQRVFLGVEHVGLYPTDQSSWEQIAAWYRQRFGFKVEEGKSSVFVAGQGAGRIEAWKERVTDRCHVAIRVSDFEAAVEELRAQGVELEEPKVKAGVKAVFLKETDPAGNLVHLYWSA